MLLAPQLPRPLPHSSDATGCSVWLTACIPRLCTERIPCPGAALLACRARAAVSAGVVCVVAVVVHTGLLMSLSLFLSLSLSLSLYSLCLFILYPSIHLCLKSHSHTRTRLLSPSHNSPTFAKALEELLRLRSRLCGPTPPMTRPQPYRLADSNRGTAAAAAGTCNSVAAAGSLMQLQSCSFYVEGSMPTIDPGQPGVHPGNGYWTPAGVPLAGGASAAPSQDDHLQQGCAPAAGAATATAATAADGCVLNLGGGGAGVSAGVISTPWLSTDSVLSAGAHGNMVGRVRTLEQCTHVFVMFLRALLFKS
jgi:hypothetical protein